MAILRRFRGLPVAMAGAIWPASGWLAGADAALLSTLLGLALAFYGTAGLAGLQLPSPGGRVSWLGPLVGGVNGIVTGFTGILVVPGALYLQALRLAPGVLVQAMGALFFWASAWLTTALAARGLLAAEVSLLSLLATAPALAGLWLGVAGA